MSQRSRQTPAASSPQRPSPQPQSSTPCNTQQSTR
uniref:Uncharacterized protein n=1 Tax=Arundo donax TaxID=35708 RepID=A0A0A9CMV7_ARUDO